jgi:hypothetical protein
LALVVALFNASPAEAQFSSHAFSGEPANRFEPTLYAARPVTVLPNGAPRVFRAGGAAGTAFLTLAARSRLERIATALRPSYRSSLAYLFSGPPTQPQRFVVFLDGHPEVPALNTCEAVAGCECRAVYIVDPQRRVMPLTIRPCLSNNRIWGK